MENKADNEATKDYDSRTGDPRANYAVTRYDVNDQVAQAADDGTWVRFEDVQPMLKQLALANSVAASASIAIEDALSERGPRGMQPAERLNELTRMLEEAGPIATEASQYTEADAGKGREMSLRLGEHLDYYKEKLIVTRPGSVFRTAYLQTLITALEYLQSDLDTEEAVPTVTGRVEPIEGTIQYREYRKKNGSVFRPDLPAWAFIPKLRSKLK